MLNTLDVIYREWCEDLKDSEEVNDAMEIVSSLGEKLRGNAGDEFFELDCAILNYASESQRQGFMAGFEIARRLLIGSISNGTTGFRRGFD